MDFYTIYIAGPMSGLPQLNYPAFLQAAKYFRARGYRVECPAEGAPPGLNWEAYMRRSVTMMLRCGAVCFLPGWQHSRGARIEHDLAKALGMAVRYAPEDGL